MSKSAFLAPAVVVGVIGAYVALGGEPGLFGLLKAAIVGVFSGGVVFGLGAALAALVEPRNRARQMLDEFRRHTQDLPALHEFETLARSRGATLGPSGVAESYAIEITDAIQWARAYPGAAVQAGICGTMLGTLLACLGLHFATAGSVSLATVFIWSGGSLISAVVGFGASAVLNVKFAEFDSDIRNLKVLAEGHARELLAQNSDTQDGRLAELIAKAVAESFGQSRDIWEGLRLSSNEIQRAGVAVGEVSAQMHNAAERLGEQTEVANRVAWKLETTASNIDETAKNTAESSRLLQEIFVQLMPVFRSIQTAMEGLNRSVGTLYPALESARDLQLTIKAADLVFRNIDSQVSGMSATMHDQIKTASERMVLNQQNALLDGVGPPLKSIAHSMDLLLLLIDRSEQLLRNLPLAVPAKRIVDDLNAAGAAHLAGAERDARTVQEVAQRLETAESRMEAVLQELKSAHTEIATSITALASETAEISRSVDEVTAHIEGPFWKKLGGRKA
jgi:hypothetical protein